MKLQGFWVKKGSTKKNFEMYLRAGKTKKFSVFHVENGKIQSNVMVLCVFQCRNTCNLGVKHQLFLRFIYVFYEITRFLGKKRLILSKLQMIYANKCSILFSFRKLNTFRLKRTLKCT